MTETVLDSLVVRLRADTGQLKRELSAATRSLRSLDGLSHQTAASLGSLSGLGISVNETLGRATEQAVRRMTGALEQFARTGKLSFKGLRDTALSALGEITASLTRGLLAQVFGGLSGRGFLGAVFSGLGGLPFGFRADGGPVSPGRSFLVGERGPELFTPATAGRITPSHRVGEGGRVTNISITVNGATEPSGLRRSAGQIATAVRLAVERAERNV